MARTYKCPFDGKIFLSVKDLEKYTEKNYKNQIPKSYDGDVSHYLYDYRNGPGKCQICGYPTKWDSENKRYNILCEPLTIGRFLSDPFRTSMTFFKNKGNSCSTVMRKNFEENMLRTKGKVNFMNDPDYQEKLLKSRKIAKVVSFKGKEFTVIGSYEERFVKVLDYTDIRADQLEAPGPTVTWKDDQNKERIHVTDFFIKPYNLVVSIKDGGVNKNNHPSMVDRRKMDAYKFKAIVDSTFYNAIELNGEKEIDNFPNYLLEVKQSKDRYIKYPEYYWDYMKK